MVDRINALPTEPLRALKWWVAVSLVGVYCLSPAQATAKENPRHMLAKMVNRTDYKCLSSIIEAESSWNTQSSSPTHDYGLPQRHMPTHTQKQIKAWLSDTHKQLVWMIAYTKARYGSPCQAATFRDKNNWY